MRRRLPATGLFRAGALSMALLLAACGSHRPLADADDAMATLDSGRLRLQLSATAGAEQPTGPVGFRMEGPFSTAKGELPLLDLRYTRLLGGDEVMTRIVSTGDAVYLVADGKVSEVPVQKTAQLRLGDGDGGIADLGIAGWIKDAVVEERDDGTKTVSGELDVADFLSDLARVGEQVGGGGGGKELDSAAAGRLQRLARSSELTVELGADDLPRSLKAVVDFGDSVPEELRQTLGQYASVRLELTLALERLTEPLVVKRPLN
ncbi:MAG TPA: hypothetical protein VNA57_02175 [Acidimicrobiales bacterium]|nr:hypothetical protein [Acidimicrobiales bacterium]